MIVASFLIKDLRIDWQSGERYFMQHLIDADVAANNGNWQWCASTGTDSMPGYRFLTLRFRAKSSTGTEPTFASMFLNWPVYRRNGSMSRIS